MTYDVPMNSATKPPAAGAILIADDNRTVGRVIGKILEREGHQVRLVADGPAALDALFHQPIQLALLSANLPGMNAMEVTNLYRFGSIGRQRLPILGLISDVTAPTLSAWINAGFDGCIGKPIEPTELLEAVNASLSVSASRPAPAEAPTKLELMPEGPAIDPRVLRDLEKLGGRTFIEDVIEQFVMDASRLFPDLATAAAAGDSIAFRDHIHALRSCAGNVGATGLYKMCLAWRAMGPRELAEHGSECVTRLEAEFERAADALDLCDWREPTINESVR